MKFYKVFLIGIVSLALLLTSCPQSAEPDIEPTETYEFTASDGVVVSVESPVEVTLSEAAPGTYPTGMDGTVINIDGTLGNDQSLTIEFSRDTGFVSGYTICHAVVLYIGNLNPQQSVMMRKPSQRW